GACRSACGASRCAPSGCLSRNSSSVVALETSSRSRIITVRSGGKFEETERLVGSGADFSIAALALLKPPRCAPASAVAWPKGGHHLVERRNHEVIPVREEDGALMLIILILLLVLALGGGAWGHSRWGYTGWSPAGLLVLVLLLLWLTGGLR